MVQILSGAVSVCKKGQVGESLEDCGDKEDTWTCLNLLGVPV
jgi:hypothetical protein